MGWVKEFGKKFEVPGLVGFLVKKGALVDLSWKNDISPSFGLHDEETNQTIRLWVEHPIKEAREYQDQRFLVTVGESGTDTDKEFATEDFKEALDYLFSEIGAYVKQRRGTLAGDPWHDPEEYLKNLTDEYYDW